jgi:diacylglycerol kinase family enzyme
MKYALIANPHARNGRGARKLARLREELERRGLRHDLALCASLEDARRLSREANDAGCDVIVAVGGDGTINRVLNGFFDPSGRRLSRARLGVVHIGTSPDFCRSYGVPTEIVPAVEALEAAVTRQIAVGHARYELQAGEPAALGGQAACFGCCANIGLGASLARLANAGIRKYLGDCLGTFFALLRVLCVYRPRTLNLKMDGAERTLDRVFNIAVGKTTCIASGLKVRHALGDADQRFYVLTLRDLTPRRLVPVLRALYRGRPITPGPGVSLEYAREITVAAAGTEVEFDGDPVGFCPCQIQTAADPLDLIVEAGA